MPFVRIEPKMPASSLLRLLGGKSNRSLSCSLEATIIRLKRLLPRLLDPKLVYHTIGLGHCGPSGVAMEGGCTLLSPKLSRTFENCQEAICFLATLGSRFDEAVSEQFARKRFADGFVLDTMGSVVVENLVNRFQQRIRQQCHRKNRDVTLRFSPGYCDWPVTEQEKLFKWLDNRRIDVKLSRSCLMSPRKSVSGVFGILPETATSPPYNPCCDCLRQSCNFRRN